MMRSILLTLMLLAALAPAVAAQPQPDPRAPAFISWLLHSPSPMAQIMRGRVNDGPRALAHELVLARQAGIRLDTAQMQRTLPPPEQNAAPLYVRLTQVLQARPLNLPTYAEKSLSASEAYTPEQIAAVRKVYEARQDVWTLAHQAADKPQCVFQRDWTAGAGGPYPADDDTIRTAVRLVRTESYLWARDGKYAEALTDDSLCLHMAEQAGAEPTIISYLVGNACEAIALNSFHDTLLLAGPNAEVDAQAEAMVASHRPNLSLRNGLAGEPTLMGIEFARMHRSERFGFNNMMTTGMPGAVHAVTGKPAPPAEQAFTHNLIDAWQADYLHQMRRLILAATLPPAERRTVFVAATRDRHNDFPPDLTQIISDIIMPVFSKMDENDTRIHAREALTMAVAAILGAKAKSGAFPAQIPQDFIDPYTNKPLGYRREGENGFVVYSVGPTGQFDGGKPGQKTPGTESLFRYPAVALPSN